jgi:hypothetical protein
MWFCRTAIRKTLLECSWWRTSTRHFTLLAHSSYKNQDLRMAVLGTFCPYFYINTVAPEFDFQPFSSLEFYYFTIGKPMESSTENCYGYEYIKEFVAKHVLRNKFLCTCNNYLLHTRTMWLWDNRWLCVYSRYWNTYSHPQQWTLNDRLQKGPHRNW